ncbi:MAG: response regulator, partial [Phycisphaeraceae bacterium]|nr:response regulator [Phycisphaeraceae bacterium]
MTDESRILVVDDDPIVADSIAEFLDREGYLSSTACDGHEAMTLLDGMTQRVSDDLDTAAASDTGALTAVADHRAFGLVITDLNMPRGNGIELLKQMNQSRRTTVI